MAVIEQGKNTSFQWDEDNMRVINRYDLENSSPSSLINRGIEKIHDTKELKRKMKDFKQGHATLGELIKAIEDL